MFEINKCAYVLKVNTYSYVCLKLHMYKYLKSWYKLHFILCI